MQPLRLPTLHPARRAARRPVLCHEPVRGRRSAQARGTAKDPLEPARAALRTLQFDKAITLLGTAGDAGNADAQYLLGLMYLNGVGVVADSARGRTLLQSAAEHGQGAAAYVLAGELARDRDATPESARQWLERSAKIGYYRAVEALKSGRPLLDRESVGASDPTLLTPWVIDCVRKNDAAELRRLGPVTASVRDEFGRGALSHAAAAGTLAAATVLLELGADVRAVDKAGTTALMLAAAGSDPAMVDLLLQHGADPQSVDAEQRTALFYAARANRAANVGALQRAGALLDAKDTRGYNPLDAALGGRCRRGRRAAAHAGSACQPGHRRSRAGRAASSMRRTRATSIGAGRRWRSPCPATTRRPCSSCWRRGGDANLRLPQGDSLLAGRCRRACHTGAGAAAGARRRCDRYRSFGPHRAVARRDAQRRRRGQGAARRRRAARCARSR